MTCCPGIKDAVHGEARGAIYMGGFHLCSGYLHTAVGIHHKLNLDWLQAAVGVLSTLKGPWILAADFNCSPQQLEETGWLKMVSGCIVGPLQPTCIDRVIDFFVVSNCMAGMVVGQSLSAMPCANLTSRHGCT